MKRKGLLLLLLPLLLTSCGANKDAFYVPFNLDYYTNDKKENLTPTSIKPKQLRIMLESKTSFVLYYYSDSCEACKSSTNLLNQYISKNSLQIYQINSLDVYKEQKILGNWMFLFEEAKGTPQIMFFNGGQLVAMMPQNKYTSGYNAFEGTMNSITIESNILTATKEKSLKHFFENYKQYMIYFSKSEYINNENPYANYAYTTFNDKFYPVVKAEKKFRTLFINTDLLTLEGYRYLNDKFNFEAYKSPYSVLLHYETLPEVREEVYSYSSDVGVENILNKLDEYFINAPESKNNEK